MRDWSTQRSTLWQSRLRLGPGAGVIALFKSNQSRTQFTPNTGLPCESSSAITSEVKASTCSVIPHLLGWEGLAYLRQFFRHSTYPLYCKEAQIQITSGPGSRSHMCGSELSVPNCFTQCPNRDLPRMAGPEVTRGVSNGRSPALAVARMLYGSQLPCRPSPLAKALLYLSTYAQSRKSYKMRSLR